MRKESMNNPSSTNKKDMSTNKSGSASDNDSDAMPQKSLADREKESREPADN